MGNKIIMKVNKIIISIVSVLIAAIIGYFFISKLFINFDQTLFYSDFVKGKMIENKNQTNIINESGTANYFKDNFNQYSKYSKKIESFEDKNNVKINGVREVYLSQDSYEGNFSLGLNTNTVIGDNGVLVINKKFNEPVDLSSWSKSGFFTLWLNIKDRKGITGVELKLGDEGDGVRTYNILENQQLNIPDLFNNDDIYPDIKYPEGDNQIDEWTDYSLQKGWNYLLWRADEEYFVDEGNIDFANVSWFEVKILISKDFVEQKILIDDLRVQDGLQKNRNSLNGIWYPPHGRPQYGVFDVDNYSEYTSGVKLLNVRQSQYPSNGDHGRMILKYNAPNDFGMRTRFKIVNYNNNNINTWFRMMYDFDPEWDPGHDWFGTFVSFEWSKFGIISVSPIERYLIQEQEPLSGGMGESSVSFTPKNNTLYEIQLIVRGQDAEAVIYEIVNEKYIKKGSVQYTFKRQRYGNDKRYPFALEITGNVKAIIDEVEIIEL
jgi:hypothetical protein